MKVLLTGDEAIARGAYEAGVQVATGYPGTPSTEILEHLGTYEGLSCNWAPNEKVALEEAIGASFGGARALMTCKHVGLNVAADPLFTVAYQGVNGGLVIVVADEPGMFSSQNEQDSRIYAYHSKVAMLEPSDSQECKDFMREAFELSEANDTPVIVRITTRVCHSKSPVELSDRIEVPVKPYTKNVQKNVMLPANARVRHVIMEETRLPRLRELSNASPLNAIENNNSKIGIITNSAAYHHVKEVFGDRASYLKLGFTHPLPDEKIRAFSEMVETLYIVEENEPYIETYTKSLGIPCVGKELIPICGELSPGLLRKIFFKEEAESVPPLDVVVPNRPPALCAGCPHRGIFYEVGQYKDKIIASSDIGCYTLGAGAPLFVGDTCICMGAGFSAAVGFARAQEFETGEKRKIFGFLGDSTFFHSGITGLVDIVYSHANVVAVILDNSITAMTGHQQNPGTGKSLQGEITDKVDIKKLVESLGFEEGKNLAVTDPYNMTQTREAVKKAYESTGPYVLIVKRECALIKEVQKKRASMKCVVDPEKCVGCKKCLKLGCPAVQFDESKKKMEIDKDTCVGCTMCLQVCPFDAISFKGANS